MGNFCINSLLAIDTSHNVKSYGAPTIVYVTMLTVKLFASLENYIKKLTIFLIFISLNAFAQESFYWKENKKLYKKIIEDRKVFVSAKSITDNSGITHLKLSSAGLISANESFVWSRLLEFKQYKYISSYVKESQYNENKKQLYVKLCAFKFCAAMKMQLKIKDSEKRIEFVVIEGNFKGMSGFYSTFRYKPNKTEIAMKSSYSAVKLPIPKIFLDFGLEVAGQKLCSAIRSFIEDAFQKSLKRAK